MRQDVATLSRPRSPDRGRNGLLPLSSRRRRFSGYLLDITIVSLTFWVGWFLFALIVYRRFGSPGSLLLHMRVVDQRTGGKPRLWQAIRRGVCKWIVVSAALLPAALGVLAGLAAAGVDRLPGGTERIHDAVEQYLAPLLTLVIIVVLATLFSRDQQRQTVWDKFAGTVVVDA